MPSWCTRGWLSSPDVGRLNMPNSLLLLFYFKYYIYLYIYIFIILTFSMNSFSCCLNKAQPLVIGAQMNTFGGCGSRKTLFAAPASALWGPRPSRNAVTSSGPVRMPILPWVKAVEAGRRATQHRGLLFQCPVALQQPLFIWSHNILPSRYY